MRFTLCPSRSKRLGHSFFVTGEQDRLAHPSRFELGDNGRGPGPHLLAEFDSADELSILGQVDQRAVGGLGVKLNGSRSALHSKLLHQLRA